MTSDKAMFFTSPRMALLASCLSLISVNLCLAQGQPTSILKQQLSVEAQSTTPADYVAYVLRRAGAPGGIEEPAAACGTYPERSFKKAKSSLDEALAQLNASRSDYSWSETGGVVLVRQSGAKQSLLDTDISEFTFDRRTPLYSITDRLLALTEVQTQVAKENLFERSPEFGFAQLSQPSKAAEGDSVTLKNLTLRQALSKVALARQSAVWHFRETNCDGRRTFTLTWIVK